jgi:hypothetical protein
VIQLQVPSTSKLFSVNPHYISDITIPTENVPTVMIDNIIARVDLDIIVALVVQSCLLVYTAV